MIHKPFTTLIAKNHLEEAGVKAEQQMAFYLKRAFENDDRFHVFNDIRFEVNGDAAQIDHLVISKFGFTFVESKSISSQVKVNSNNEWIRVYNNKEKGIPSPVLQAKRQSDFLATIMKGKDDIFFPTRKIMQHRFDRFQWTQLVAISDNGIIKSDIQQPQVFKADQITDILISKHDELDKKQNSLFSTEIVWSMEKSTLSRLTDLLLKLDTPLGTNPKTTFDETLELQKIQSEQLSIPEFSCKACNKSNLETTYGKFGYYFKCLDCDANTGIPKAKCDCGVQLRVSKKQKVFSMVCKECESSEVFWENK